MLETGLIICYIKRMDREHILATLRSHEPDLRHRGVRHAALFGSMARNESTPTSDIDILIDLEPDSRIGVFGYVALTHYLAGLFPVPVDVANRGSLKPHVQPSAERDAVYAFSVQLMVAFQFSSSRIIETSAPFYSDIRYT